MFTVAGASLEWASETQNAWSRRIHHPVAPFLHYGAPVNTTTRSLEMNVQRHVILMVQVQEEPKDKLYTFTKSGYVP